MKYTIMIQLTVQTYCKTLPGIVVNYCAIFGPQKATLAVFHVVVVVVVVISSLRVQKSLRLS